MAMLVVVSCLILSVGLNLAMVSVGCVGFGFGCVGSGVEVGWLWRWGDCGCFWLCCGWWRWLWPVERFLWWICFILFYFILTSSLYYFNQISKNINLLMLSVL